MSGLHLGLDLGGTNIKVALVSAADGDMRVASTDSVDTGAGDGPEVVTTNLIEVGLDAVERFEVATLGLGVPGHFDRDSGEVLLFPNLPGDWSGFPLRTRLEEAVGIDIWMINDARAFTLAEGVLGAGKGCDPVACITLGTGVGGV